VVAGDFGGAMVCLHEVPGMRLGAQTDGLCGCALFACSGSGISWYNPHVCNIGRLAP
jgi:hypothetical protein